MKDPNDMERFHDTCEDTRTESQIVWEEGLLRNNSLLKKWEYNFGKNDFYKFGKKIASILMLMFLWTVFSIIIGNNSIEMLLNAVAVVAVNAGSIWLYRQKEADGKFTVLNTVYIIGCCVFTFVFYRYMDFVFGYFGHAMFLSLYYGVYFISRNTAVIVRLVISGFVIYNLVRYNTDKKAGDVSGAVFSVVSVLTGLIFKFFMPGNFVIYNICICVLIVTTVGGFLLYIWNKNRFMRNVTLAFSFVSLMEVIGSYAVASGIMEKYIESGVF